MEILRYVNDQLIPGDIPPTQVHNPGMVTIFDRLGRNLAGK